MQKTQVLSHLNLLEHGLPGHPENRVRLEAIFSALQSSPYSSLLNLSLHRLATLAEISQIHTRDYVESIFRLEGKSAEIDPETLLTPGSTHAARLAAGLGLELLHSLLKGQIQNGFLLGRPPGHHSRPGQGMGFCIFNSIAIAAKSALAQGMKKILILDWDVHHGNGTQEAFYEDDRVLFIDLHQENLFPAQSGLLLEKGKDKGLGFTINIPLPHSCRDSDYFHVFDYLVSPIAKKYRPELILVSAGFDAHESDPLGSMYLTTAGFGLLTERVKRLANELCGGKLLLFLEGGYHPDHLARNVVECVSALSRENPLSETAPSPAYSDEVATLIKEIYESLDPFLYQNVSQ